MSVFEEIINQTKNNIWPKLMELLVATQELMKVELLYLNSTFSYSRISAKKMILLILAALATSTIAALSAFALIIRYFLQSFPQLNINHLLLSSTLVFGIFFIILTLEIKKQLKDLKNEAANLVKHFKEYDYGSRETTH